MSMDDLIAKLTDENDRLRAALMRCAIVPWTAVPNGSWCTVCTARARWGEPLRHADDCLLNESPRHEDTKSAEQRIEDANIAASETQKNWGWRFYRVMSALGLDYGDPDTIDESIRTDYERDIALDLWKFLSKTGAIGGAGQLLVCEADVEAAFKLMKQRRGKR